VDKRPVQVNCDLSVLNIRKAPFFQREEKCYPPFLKGDKGGLGGVFQRAKVLP